MLPPSSNTTKKQYLKMFIPAPERSVGKLMEAAIVG
jgi:hypothetical protein